MVKKNCMGLVGSALLVLAGTTLADTVCPNYLAGQPVTRVSYADPDPKEDGQVVCYNSTDSCTITIPFMWSPTPTSSDNWNPSPSGSSQWCYPTAANASTYCGFTGGSGGCAPAFSSSKPPQALR